MSFSRMNLIMDAELRNVQNSLTMFRLVKRNGDNAGVLSEAETNMKQIIQRFLVPIEDSSSSAVKPPQARGQLDRPAMDAIDAIDARIGALEATLRLFELVQKSEPDSGVLMYAYEQVQRVALVFLSSIDSQMQASQSMPVRVQESKEDESEAHVASVGSAAPYDDDEISQKLADLTLCQPVCVESFADVKRYNKRLESDRIAVLKVTLALNSILKDCKITDKNLVKILDCVDAVFDHFVVQIFRLFTTYGISGAGEEQFDLTEGALDTFASKTGELYRMVEQQVHMEGLSSETRERWATVTEKFKDSLDEDFLYSQIKNKFFELSKEEVVDLSMATKAIEVLSEAANTVF